MEYSELGIKQHSESQQQKNLNISHLTSTFMLYSFKSLKTAENNLMNETMHLRESNWKKKSLSILHLKCLDGHFVGFIIACWDPR